MKKGHTPGPWEASNNNIWAEDEQFLIAMAMDVPFGDRLKNTELIAAAPKMYEALKRVEKLYPEVFCHIFGDEVLAKVEGRG